MYVRTDKIKICYFERVCYELNEYTGYIIMATIMLLLPKNILNFNTFERNFIVRALNLSCPAAQEILMWTMSTCTIVLWSSTFVGIFFYLEYYEVSQIPRTEHSFKNQITYFF
jgi:hypothetical protein